MALLRNSRVICRSIASVTRALDLTSKTISPNCAATVSRLNLYMPQQLHTSSINLNKNIVNIQDEDDFQKQVVESSVPVIVDFHAT